MPDKKEDIISTYYINLNAGGRDVNAFNDGSEDVSHNYFFINSLHLEKFSENKEDKIIIVAENLPDIDQLSLPYHIHPQDFYPDSPTVYFTYQNITAGGQVIYNSDNGDPDAFHFSITKRYNSIVEGIFEGTVYSTQQGVLPIKIKEGKFKLKYRKD